ncbi:MAG: Transcriptional regulator, AsnC family [Clostridiales bacterium 38_11]|nr:MAG: Transcriptional regulator, AsnC family [Clostridiales bacterium 38_11]HBH12308.1 AsnC family transcriptional regulator [Clostridiales bacterium]
MTFNNLDAIDMDILKILSQNGRESYIEIGKQVNLSRVSVKTRIDAMLEEGVIESFSVIINPEKTGQTVSVFLDIKILPEYLYGISSELSTLPFITDIYHMTGSSKLHVHALFINKEELSVFLEQKLYKMHGIENVNCDMIVSRIKCRKGIRP